MLKSFILLLSFVLSTGCAARIMEMTARQRSERLATERGSLSELSEPVDRTKSYITISEILLSFALDSIQDGETGEIKTLLEQYVMAVENARDTMVMSKLNPERQSGGFRELEIALRRHLRLLEDMNRLLRVEERKPVEDAVTTATSVREEMISLLFPRVTPAA